MKAKECIFILLLIVCFVTSSCGTKQMISGRVVDAETGHPIEGAAVAIKWVHYKWGPPGLPTPKERLGTTETLTDEQGNFTIPRYLWRSHYMGVYKDGYVAWSSETIFNPNGKVHDEIFQKRFWHRVANGMKIKLQPIPADISTEMRERHAHFTVDAETRLWASGPFENAIRYEEELHVQSLRRNLEEK